MVWFPELLRLLHNPSNILVNVTCIYNKEEAFIGHFVNEKVIGAEIKTDFTALNYGKGYDNCWVIDGAEPGQIQEAAYLYAPESGRTLTIYTTQPGVQVYPGNWLSGCPAGKNSHVYEDYDGVAIECQNLPDAPNQPEYPSAVLRPGEVYEQAIIFAFGIR